MADEIYQATLGSALLIPSGPNNKLHLYFAITDCCVDDRHLLVSITSIPPNGHYDQTCLISAGEHDFIKHASYTLYRKPEIYSATKISRFVALNYFKVLPSASESLIDRISLGILESDFTPQYHQNYYKEQIV